jgi:hypothetical protein
MYYGHISGVVQKYLVGRSILTPDLIYAIMDEAFHGSPVLPGQC